MKNKHFCEDSSLFDQWNGIRRGLLLRHPKPPSGPGSETREAARLRSSQRVPGNDFILHMEIQSQFVVLKL